MTLPQKILDLDFTHLEFFENYVISELHEDIVLDLEKLHRLIIACNDYYGKKNHVYISKRKNNYNVNPTIYMGLNDVKNLCGIAVVSQKTSSLNMAHFEKNFSKIPYEVFLELPDAIAWAENQVKK